MPDQTIDAIKVKLGVDASDIASGVKDANKALDVLGNAKRKVNIELHPVWEGQKQAAVTRRIESWKKGLRVPVTIDINKEGKFSTAELRTKIQKDLSAGGGVNVPIRVALGAADAQRIRKEISTGIGVVPIYFDWIANGPPTFEGKVKVDWEWGDGPGGAPGGPPSGGRGGGPAPAPMPTAGPPSTPTAPSPGKQPGETRAQASARHKAEHEAARKEQEAARERAKAADGARTQAKREQDAQRQSTSTGSRSTTPGPVGETTRRAERTAERAEKEAARATEEASKVKTKVARTERQLALDKEAAELRTRRAEIEAMRPSKSRENKLGHQGDLEKDLNRRRREAARDARKAAPAPAPTPAPAPAPAPAPTTPPAAPTTPPAGGLGGTGSRPRPIPAPTPVAGAPKSSGTTGSTTATNTASRGVGANDVGGANDISRRRGSQSSRRSFRGSDAPRGFGPEGEDLPGEQGTEGARIRAARMARIRGQLEIAAREERDQALRESLDPTIGGESWDSGDLDEMLPGLQEMMGEPDPNRQRQLIADFRLKASGRGGVLQASSSMGQAGDIVRMDPKKKKRARKMARRLQMQGTGNPDLELIAHALSGEAGFTARVRDWQGQNVNLVSADAGGGIAGQRSGAPGATSHHLPWDVENPRPQMGQEYWENAEEELRDVMPQMHTPKPSRLLPDPQPFPAWTVGGVPFPKKKDAVEARAQELYQKELAAWNARRQKEVEKSEKSNQGKLARQIAAMRAQGATGTDEELVAKLTRSTGPQRSPTEKAGFGLGRFFDAMRDRSDFGDYLGPRSSISAKPQPGGPVDPFAGWQIAAPHIGRVVKPAGLPGELTRRSSEAKDRIASLMGFPSAVELAKTKSPKLGLYSEKLSSIRSKLGENWMEEVLKPDFDITKYGDGGIYSRGIGHRFSERGDSKRSLASQNTTEWKKIRAAHLRKNSFCTHCGMGRTEAKDLGTRLTVDAIQSEAHGGSHTDPENLQTLCLGCNSRKSGFSHQPEELWGHARPRMATRHPKVGKTKPTDWMAGGKFFGAATLRQVLKKRSEGGASDELPAKRGRMWHFVINGKPQEMQGSEEEIFETLRRYRDMGVDVRPGRAEDSGRPASFKTAASHIRRRAEGGIDDIDRITPVKMKFTPIRAGNAGLVERLQDYVQSALPETGLQMDLDPEEIQPHGMLSFANMAGRLGKLFPETASGVSRILVPNTPDQFRALRGVEDDKTPYAFTNRTGKPGLHQPSEIIIHPSMFTEKSAEAHLARRTKAGWFAAVEDLGGLLAHEFAHSIDIANDSYGTVASQALHMPGPGSVPHPSDYAKRNPSEDFAETVSQHLSFDPEVRDRVPKAWQTVIGSLRVRAEGGELDVPKIQYLNPWEVFDNPNAKWLGPDYFKNKKDDRKLPGGPIHWRKAVGWDDKADPYKDEPWNRRAEGGYVKHGGLLERMAQAGHQPSVTLVGERGPELAVTDPNTGSTEIVPTHKVPTWLQRASDGKGFAKDLTGRADGGAAPFGRSIRPLGGGSGPYATRMARASGAAIAANLASPTTPLRVFVVNWPPQLGTAQPIVGAPVGQAASNTRQNQPLGGVNAGNAGARPAGNQAAQQQQQQANPGGPFRPLSTRTRREAREGNTRWEDLLEQNIATASGISEAQSLTPVRALSVAFGQITSQLTGRAKIQERARKAGAYESIAVQEQSQFLAAEQSVKKIGERMDYINDLRRQGKDLSKSQLEFEANHVELLQEATAEVEEQYVYAKRAADRAQVEKDRILKRGDVSRNLVSGGVGVVAGTLAFSAVFNAANIAIQQFVDISQKAIERMSGWHNVAAEVTGTLADQTRAAGGATRQVLALAEAQSGLALSATDTLGPLFEQRVRTEAGNKAIVEQIKQLHAMRAVSAQGQLPGGYDRGLVETTGGLNILGAQTMIGGVPSFYEQLNNELRGQSAVTGQEQVSPIDLAQMILPNLISPIGALIGGGGLNPFDRPGKPTPPEEAEASKQFALAFMEDMAAAAERGGGSLDMVAVTTDDLRATQARQIEMLEKSTIPAFRDLAGTLKASDTAFEGTFASLSEFQKYLLEGGQAAARGASIPDMEQLQRSMLGEPGRMGTMEVQLRANRRQRIFQQEQQIPAQVAMQYAARPMVAYNDPRLRPSENVLGRTGSAGFAQQSKQYEQAFKKYESYALPAQQAITAEIEKGRKVLESWGVPKSEIDAISSIGKSIQDIQLGISQQGLNLTVAQYNNELRIANRSLQDARDLQAGIKGQVKDTLGGMEGQNVLLSRQLQLLEQELAQRQINFKLAMAGFTAPGDTPEQRQARIDEAKIEAEYAQKQLNIQKQMSSNQFQITGIQAGRSVTDLQAQISLLTQGRELAINTDAAQKALEALQGQEDILMEKALARVEEGQKAGGIWMQAVADWEAATGKAFDNLSPEFTKIFEDAGYTFANAIKAAINPSTYTGTGRSSGGGSWGTSTTASGGTNAEGFLGSFSSPTQMTFGEAGTETVAILRNPRTMTVGGNGGGGGGGPMIFNININGGGSDIDKKKLDQWAREIAVMVESSLNRRTSLLGLRTP